MTDPTPGTGDAAAPDPFRPRPFRPSSWLPGPHAHTLAGKLLRPYATPELTRVRLDTPDGDFLDLDLGPEPAEGAPLGLVLHGLEGSSRRRYALMAYEALLERGVRPVGMNFRGCSGEPNRAPRFYHSGETGDLRYVLDRLGERFPDRPVGVLGFSLGGNVLLKFLGEEADREPQRVRAAVAVSVPFDLAAGAEQLEKGLMGPLYTYYFVRMLRQKVRARADLLGAHVDVDAGLAARTLRAFDDAVTAPLHGFADAAEYYRRSSSARFLDRIRVPALLLQSRDDPFLPRSALPEREIAANPHLVPAITERGGHVGFVEGPPWDPRFWADEEGARFLAHHLHAEEPSPSDVPSAAAGGEARPRATEGRRDA